MAMKHYNQTVGFADRLNEAISDIGMPQKQLAEKIGMERKTASMWVNGYSMPNSLILARICKVLSVSADYLLFGERGDVNGS